MSAKVTVSWGPQARWSQDEAPHLWESVPAPLPPSSLLHPECWVHTETEECEGIPSTSQQVATGNNLLNLHLRDGQKANLFSRLLIVAFQERQKNTVQDKIHVGCESRGAALHPQEQRQFCILCQRIQQGDGRNRQRIFLIPRLYFLQLRLTKNIVRKTKEKLFSCYLESFWLVIAWGRRCANNVGRLHCLPNFVGHLRGLCERCQGKQNVSFQRHWHCAPNQFEESGNWIPRGVLSQI